MVEGAEQRTEAELVWMAEFPQGTSAICQAEWQMPGGGRIWFIYFNLFYVDRLLYTIEI